MEAILNRMWISGDMLGKFMNLTRGHYNKATLSVQHRIRLLNNEKGWDCRK